MRSGYATMAILYPPLTDEEWTKALYGEAKSCSHKDAQYEDLVAFILKERSCVSVQTMVDKLLQKYRVIER